MKCDFLLFWVEIMDNPVQDLFFPLHLDLTRLILKNARINVRLIFKEDQDPLYFDTEYWNMMREKWLGLHPFGDKSPINIKLATRQISLSTVFCKPEDVGPDHLLASCVENTSSDISEAIILLSYSKYPSFEFFINLTCPILTEEIYNRIPNYLIKIDSRGVIEFGSFEFFLCMFKHNDTQIRNNFMLNLMEILSYETLSISPEKLKYSLLVPDCFTNIDIDSMIESISIDSRTGCFPQDYLEKLLLNQPRSMKILLDDDRIDFDGLILEDHIKYMASNCMFELLQCIFEHPRSHVVLVSDEDTEIDGTMCISISLLTQFTNLGSHIYEDDNIERSKKEEFLANGINRIQMH